MEELDRVMSGGIETFRLELGGLGKKDEKSIVDFAIKSLREIASTPKRRGIQHRIEKADADISTEDRNPVSHGDELLDDEFGNVVEDENFKYNPYKWKIRDGMGVINDAIRGLDRNMWKASPSISPELPERALREAAVSIIDTYGEEGLQRATDEQLISILQAYVKGATSGAHDTAKKGVERISRKLMDDAQATNFMGEFRAFLRDGLIYPAAFAIGPVGVSVDAMHWGRNTLQVGIENRLGRKRIHPSRVFTSDDNKKVAKCEKVFIADTITKINLAALLNDPLYNREAIEKILDGIYENEEKLTTGNRIDSCNDGKASYYQTVRSLSCIKISDDTEVPLIMCYLTMLGRDLNKYDDIDSSDYEKYDPYEVILVICEGEIISFSTNAYPSREKPICSISYIESSDSAWGTSMFTMIEEPVAAWLEAYSMRRENLIAASLPITEERRYLLSGFSDANDDDGENDESIGPGDTVNITDSTAKVDTSIVRRLYGNNLVPTITGVMNEEEERIHSDSGIPPQLTGFATAKGANRVGSVFTAGLENALKIVIDYLERSGNGFIVDYVKVGHKIHQIASADDGIPSDVDVSVEGITAVLKQAQESAQKGLVQQTLLQATQYRDENGKVLIPGDAYRAHSIDYLGQAGGEAITDLIQDPRVTRAINGGQPTTQQTTETSLATPLPQLDGRSR